MGEKARKVKKGEKGNLIGEKEKRGKWKKGKEVWVSVEEREVKE